MDSLVAQNYTQELYFLIAKFLEAGPCRKTLEVLKTELSENKIIPKRLDWIGGEHEQTFEELESKYPHIARDHLLKICLRIGPILDKEIKPYAPGVKTLLGAGRQSLLRTLKDVEKTHLHLREFILRRHGTSVFSPITCQHHNIVQVLFGRETSGPCTRRHLVDQKLYNRIHLINRTLGHLSAVYCVLFDRTGKYIITGSDDLLVKVWSSIDGRLLSTLRGAAAEITDIAINLENTLLAVGSLDKIIRVWCLQTAFPVATLSAHTGMITGVNFCPISIRDVHYLVSTSTDGSVAFWSFTIDRNNPCEPLVQFQPTPVLYHEKLRPGQAQMICSSFSPGGMFLATGSADHHVRVYCMSGPTPHRVMELEKHSDRVDSIEWAKQSLKLVSGSKDGTAIIWQYRAQNWHTRLLDMNITLPGTKSKDQDNKLKLRVTMVCWSADDKLVITSVNNNLIKVWSASTGKLCRELNHHRDVVYVLESHPSDPTILLSAGHDGLVYLWNLTNGEQLFVFQNHIEGQGNGAIFDAKWAPDGTLVAATDAHGHLLMFGLAVCSEKIRMLPKELFFHTDYRPMIRDASNAVLDEQTQIPPHLMPPPFLVDVDGNPYPPQLQRLVPGRENCTSDQLIPNIIFTPGGGTEIMSDMRSNIDQRIHELAHHNHFSLSSLSSPSARARWRRSGDVEGVRQSSGDWQREGLSWKQGRLILPLSQGQLNVQFHRIKFLGDLELEEYEREKTRVCDVVPVMSAPLPAAGPGRRLAHTYRTRATRGVTIQNREEEAYESAPTGGDSSNSAEMESSSSQSSSSEYSDWVADQGVNLEPPQRSRRTRKKRTAVGQSAAAIAVAASQSAAASSPASPPPVIPVASTSKAIQPAPFVASNRKLPPQIDPNGELPVLYRPSEWLSEVIPKKFPYYPQMGDEVMFFTQGYAHYVKAVQDKKLYPLAKSQLKPWGNLSLNEPELVKVIGIKYELRPPRLCCLRLAVMSPSGRLTGDRFTLKYHDIPDVIDFFVLQQTYDTAMDRNWKIGDRFRSMIDSEWWWGVIEGRRPDANSPFLCHRIRWDNGEMEDMSPWDMEPVDPEREPEKGGSMPVLPDEFAAILYHPRGDEWPGGDRDSACRATISGLEEVMGLAIAEPFSAPVDITVYKTYPYIVEFSIDLTTIKARFENRFYRRLTAAQFDIRYLATNAEKFNESHSIIVKHARIVTDLCLRICKEETYVDVQSVYRNLLESYVSSCSETETTPSTSKRERAAANRSLRAMRRANHHKKPDWRRDCQQLLEVLWNCRDSEHFRGPVDRLEHPDYDKVIDTPMDLGLVREELQGGNYATPLEFCKDVRMIFSNSRSYNTNKRSKVYVMTVRLAAMAEEHMKRIIKDWKSSCRKQNKPRHVNGVRKATPRKSKASSEEEEEDEDSEASEKLPATAYFTKGKYNTRTRNSSDKARDVSTNEDSNSASATTTTNSRGSSTAGTRRNLQPIRLKIKSQVYKANSNHNNNSNKFVDINQPSTSSGHNLRVSKEVSYVEKGNDSSSGSSSSPPSPPSSSSSTTSSSLSRKSMAKNVSTNGFIKVLRPIRKQLCFDDYAKDSEDEDEDEDTVALPKRGRTGNARRNGKTMNVVENVKKVTNRFEPSSDSDDSDTEEEIKEDKKDLDYVVKEKSSRRSVNGHVRRGQKRSRRTTSSDEYSDETEYRPRRIPGRAVRPRRKTKRPSNYDESDDEDEEYMRRGSGVDRGRKPGVGSRGRRKEYREASSREEEESSEGARPCISISSRGRVRKIRARARAFLRE